MTAPQHTTPGRSRRRTPLVVAGAILGLIGMFAAFAATVLVWFHATQRDNDGFFATDTARFATTTYALTRDIELRSTRGTLRVRFSPKTVDQLFVGVGPTDAVRAYLRNVAHEQVDRADFGPFESRQSFVSGTGSPAPPQRQQFWESAATARGVTGQLRWPAQEGRWTIVMMNADGSAGVRGDVSVGFKTNVVLAVGLLLGAGALVLFVGAGLALFFGLSGDLAGEEPLPAVNPSTYPARLTGRLDEAGLSRWLWIVKPVLLIPHFVALALLWVAMIVMTVIAGFAILFTGEYPRTIFDFNVGVVRWTWRVGFYGLSALATDRYPPFSLRSDPDYPADYTVAYPEQLSRGLVLVKWWLLAIPHYLIVAIFTGGWGAGAGGPRLLTGAGLITVLAVIAAVVLAVKGSYPTSLFDFVMGLNRWCYRVLPYVALMRDEYPPFRLDTGGTDPGDVAAGAQPGSPRPQVPAHA